MKYILSLLIFLLVGINTNFGQGWEKIYQDHTGQALEIRATTDNNFLVSGLYINENAKLGSQIMKMAPDGTSIWELNLVEHSGSFGQKLINCQNDFLVTTRTYKMIGGENLEKGKLLKIDLEGNVLWEYEPWPEEDFATKISVYAHCNDDGSTSFVAWYLNSYYLGKIDSAGNLLSLTLLPDTATRMMLKSSENTFVFVGIDPTESFVEITEVDNDGVLLGTANVNINPFYERESVLLTENDEIILFHSLSDPNIVTQTKIINYSQVTSIDTIWTTAQPYNVLGATQTTDGFLLSAGVGEHPTYSGYSDGLLFLKTDFDGNVIFAKVHNHRPGAEYGRRAIAALDEGYYVVGGYVSGSPFTSNWYVVKTDSTGAIYTNVLAGQVARDTSLDCSNDLEEEGLAEWLVTAEKATRTFSTLTNAQGDYVLPIDSGNYIITVHEPNHLWASCENNLPLNFTDFGNSAEIDFAVQAEATCPLMTISHTLPILRPCFERPSYIHYCNMGTITANDAYIEVTYDSLITPVSSTLPFVDLGNNVYRFDLGDVPALDCGSFQVDVFLDCDALVGAAYCIEAHAYPDSLCLDPNEQWTGAFLDVEGTCEGDSIYFKIENTGLGNMAEPSNIIIVEDVLLFTLDSVELLSGAFDTKVVPANGSTYAIAAEQVMNAPGTPWPTVIIEGCGQNGNGEISIGFSNQFPLNDGSQFIDIDCPIAINSFDPNDKQGFPIGYGEEHAIRPATPIEYLIRFQNTGTDTAYTVKLLDTLDTQLAISTFQRGASSHDYTLSLSGEGILEFNFQNINLPDSSANEIGSNGFVEFKITPKSTLPLGSVIRNKAAIYFDFNDPIITNETFHTIQEDFIEVIVSAINHPTLTNLSLSIHPNPVQDLAKIEINNHHADKYTLELYSLKGNLVRSEEHFSQSIIFQRNSLPPGFYIYRLLAEDGFSSTGKIIIH